MGSRLRQSGLSFQQSGLPRPFREEVWPQPASVSREGEAPSDVRQPDGMAFVAYFWVGDSVQNPRTLPCPCQHLHPVKANNASIKGNTNQLKAG
jgi:hypothetical protein